MKTYIITFTETEANHVKCNAVNEGFSRIELIGMLEIKRMSYYRKLRFLAFSNGT